MTTATRLPSGDQDHRLTPRRQNILHCIHQSVEHRGYPPSMREIADAVGLRSTSELQAMKSAAIAEPRSPSPHPIAQLLLAA